MQEVAQALELHPDHLRVWVRLYQREREGIALAGNAISPEQREIQQLKAQIKRPEMQKEILKQSTMYYLCIRRTQLAASFVRVERESYYKRAD